MRSLYISHSGMTEPLGQSQILPYLTGLSRNGYDIEILSFEHASTSRESIERLAVRLRGEKILWRPMVRSASHGLATKVWESGMGVAQGLVSALLRRPKIVHARSYLPAAVADVITSLAPGAKMLFDCRGMLGDEYVDAGYWTKDRLEYRLLKRFERRAFSRADGLVVLTDALKAWIEEQQLLGPQTHMTVIPCCVDTDKFRPDETARTRVRSELGISDKLVVVYSGSLGALYLEREMARFVGQLAARRPDVVLLALTQSNSDRFREEALASGLREDQFIVRRVSPEKMPEMLCAADLGLSLIQGCFSKLGSSPTKVAEYFACGAPVVLNEGVGDQLAFASDADACVLLSSFDAPALERAAEHALALASRPYATRSAHTVKFARARFSLAESGIPRYTALYAALAAD